MNNKEEKGKTLGEYQKKIKDLEQRIAMMDVDNSALAADLEHWKKVAAGLKGHNKQLQLRVEHYKDLNLEGDKMYESKIAELDEKSKVINGLQCQVNKIAEKNKNLESSLSADKDVIKEMENTIYELRKPWWKKLLG